MGRAELMNIKWHALTLLGNLLRPSRYVIKLIFTSRKLISYADVLALRCNCKAV